MDKRTVAGVKPLMGSAPVTIRGSDPFGFEKLLTNGGKVLPELAGIRSARSMRRVGLPTLRRGGGSQIR